MFLEAFTLILNRQQLAFGQFASYTGLFLGQFSPALWLVGEPAVKRKVG